MTRVVGNRNRSEFVLDPVEALRLGHQLDAMLAGAYPRRPAGVMRAPHRVFNQLDDQRCLDMARRINTPR